MENVGDIEWHDWLRERYPHPVHDDGHKDGYERSASIDRHVVRRFQLVLSVCVLVFYEM